MVMVLERRVAGREMLKGLTIEYFLLEIGGMKYER
jgi:hypothetical protein